MEPNTCKFHGAVFVQGTVGVQQTLKNIGNIFQVELVVELRSRRQETRSVQDASDKRVDRCIDNGLAQLLDLRNEGLQVFLENCRIDPLNHKCTGCEARDHGKDPLQTWVHHEGACLRIHASCEQYVDQVFFLLQSSTVIDLCIRYHLCEKHDGRLCVICVDVRHVQIVDEEDTFFVTRWSICSPRSLVEGSHNDALQGEGAGVVVVVDCLAHEVIVGRC
mmetsp:Transcript_60253/g.196971  ORF Transcript_60253/g.196971 Transcript_60253/m.196971 type:complete len:220 (-) Transcript_60253:1791-2450(-)